MRELDIVVNIPRKCDLDSSDVSVQCTSTDSHQSKVYLALPRDGLKQSRDTESTSRIEMVFLRYVAVT